MKDSCDDDEEMLLEGFVKTAMMMMMQGTGVVTKVKDDLKVTTRITGVMMID